MGWGNELRRRRDVHAFSWRVGMIRMIKDGKAGERLFLVQVSKECAGFAGKIKLDKDKHALLILSFLTLALAGNICLFLSKGCTG